VQREQKREFVKQFNSILKDKEFMLVADYKGLNVSQISSLREQISAANSNFRVAKNTLAKMAIKDTNFQMLDKLFVGPTSIAYSDDPVSTSKVLVDFAKDNENLKILGGAMGEKELTIDEIKMLASLPSLEVIRARLLSLLVSTQTNIACTLNATQSGLARLINTKYQEKGE
jgi:large subunit ribosomal protein L10